MKHTLSILIASASLAMAANAAASHHPDQEDPMDDPRLGERTDRICFSGGISGFREWSGGDGLILKRGVRKEYLVTFYGTCLPLRSAQRIGLDDRFGGGCLRRGDNIYVSSRMFAGGNNNPFDSERCAVKAIYMWDKTKTADDAAVESDAE